jgi:hypothetical protein
VLVVMDMSLAEMFVLGVRVRLMRVDHSGVVVRMYVLSRQMLPFTDGGIRAFPLVMRDVVVVVFVRHRFMAVLLESPSHTQCLLTGSCFEGAMDASRGVSPLGGYWEARFPAQWLLNHQSAEVWMARTKEHRSSAALTLPSEGEGIKCADHFRA